MLLRPKLCLHTGEATLLYLSSRIALECLFIFAFEWRVVMASVCLFMRPCNKVRSHSQTMATRATSYIHTYIYVWCFCIQIQYKAETLVCRARSYVCMCVYEQSLLCMWKGSWQLVSRKKTAIVMLLIALTQPHHHKPLLSLCYLCMCVYIVHMYVCIFFSSKFLCFLFSVLCFFIYLLLNFPFAFICLQPSRAHSLTQSKYLLL